jgi:hypothetical protein
MRFTIKRLPEQVQAALLWSPGPRPSPVFRSAICDGLSLNVSFSLLPTATGASQRAAWCAAHGSSCVFSQLVGLRTPKVVKTRTPLASRCQHTSPPRHPLSTHPGPPPSTVNTRSRLPTYCKAIRGPSSPSSGAAPARSSSTARPSPAPAPRPAARASRRARRACPGRRRHACAHRTNSAAGPRARLRVARGAARCLQEVQCSAGSVRRST